jgi:hypothetical protein
MNIKRKNFVSKVWILIRTGRPWMPIRIQIEQDDDTDPTRYGSTTPVYVVHT